MCFIARNNARVQRSRNGNSVFSPIALAWTECLWAMVVVVVVMVGIMSKTKLIFFRSHPFTDRK